MIKRLTKIIPIILLALTFVLGNNVFVLAAENETYIYTESMEIRMDGKIGLRVISAIDKVYYEEQLAQGKTLHMVQWQFRQVSGKQMEENWFSEAYIN